MDVVSLPLSPSLQNIGSSKSVAIILHGAEEILNTGSPCSRLYSMHAYHICRVIVGNLVVVKDKNLLRE